MEAYLIDHLFYIKKNPSIEDFCKKNLIGKITENYIICNIYEALYLYEKNIILLFLDKNNKKQDIEYIKKKFHEKGLYYEQNYITYKTLLEKGFKVRTGFKFGAEFRVYDKKVVEIIKGKTHSKWICFPVKSSEKIQSYDISAKMRVAHSTKKNLLMAVVDTTKNKITFYEIRWQRL